MNSRNFVDLNLKVPPEERIRIKTEACVRGISVKQFILESVSFRLAAEPVLASSLHLHPSELTASEDSELRSGSDED
ncbi:hypothetical protein E0D97_06910 [Oricola cellulosilytica]|uniref:DUF1778 domain-containing protein n=2 Tax=Oricola cellulosilytica TaxID=1429082 RepID=A0A4R0PCQ9_9HYPH|nr:hypothetical protein E0D97_06910 [Oricola cellulosilytica]